MIDSIVFYRSFYEALEDLDPETYKECMTAILTYGFDGIEPDDLSSAAKMAFKLIRPQLDANNERRINGQKGGRPKTEKPMVLKNDETEKPMVLKNDKTEKPNVNVNENVNVNDNANENLNVSPTEISRPSKEGMSDTSDAKAAIVEAWNELEPLGITPIRDIKSDTERGKMLHARLKQYTLENILEAIGKIKNSGFLQGKNNKGWVITFDWFIKPNNFPKVLEGNYIGSGRDSPYMQAIKDRVDIVDTWV